MTPKNVFAALGILLAILSYVIASGAVPLIAGGVISVGVSVLIPPP